MSNALHRSYTFGGFRLDVANHALTHDGRAVLLKPKAFDLLRLLVENRGRVLSKDEILEAVWPGVAVEEAVLTQNVYEIRKALASADAGNRYVETVPKRGYRFVAGDGSQLEEDRPIVAVAVLPFRRLGTLDEHLGRGFADTVITSLSGIEGVAVRPLSASSRYDDPLSAGRALHARYVVDGTVQGAGETLRASIRLLETETGKSLVARRFDGTMQTIFSLQDDVASALLSAIKRDGRAADARPRAPGTTNREAHHLYMKGRYAWSKSTPDALWKALDLFRAATEEDPSYGLAWVGIADVYTSLDWYGVLSTRESNPHALAAAGRALAIDPGLAEAHASLAMAKQYAWDWAGAEAGYRHSIELDPHYAPARQWYAAFLAFMGRFEEALDESARAEDLDPVSLSVAAQRGMILMCARRLEDAERHLRDALEFDATNLEASFYLGLTLDAAGKHGEAIRVLRGLPEGNPDFVCALVHALGVSGAVNEGDRLLRDVMAMKGDSYLPWFWIAIAQTGLGHFEEAIDSLHRSCDDPDDSMLAVNVFPMLDPLRAHDRWRTILARMGLMP